MGKALKWIGLAVVVLIVVSWLVRQPLLNRAVVRTVERELGGSVELSSVSISLLRSRLTVDDLVLINPRDFPTEAELHIRTIEVDYRFWGLWRDPVPLRRVELDIERLIVPFDIEALMQLRGTTLRDLRRPRTEREPSALPVEVEQGQASIFSDIEPSSEKPASARRIRRSVFIDHLVFRLGEIMMVMDYPTGEGVPIVLNLEQNLTNVDSADQLALSISHTLMLHQ